MNRARLCVGALMVTVMAVPCFAAGPVRLVTVEEAIVRAVTGSPDVLAARLEPAAAEADYRKAKGIYNPQLFIQGGYEDTSIPRSSLSGTVSDSRVLSFEGGASQLFSTGATLSLGLGTTHTKTEPAVGLGRYWDTALSLDLNQPLLKNFGAEPTELAIRVAREAGRGSLEQFKVHLMDTVLQVTTEYYRLVSLREELEVRRSSMALAEKILADTRGRVAAGVLPAMEIFNAEYGMATREKEYIDTERSLADHRDALAYLLQLHEPFDVSPLSSHVDDDSGSCCDEEALAIALLERPEIREQEIGLATLELQERVARNRTRPDLSLTAGLSLAGLAGSYHRSAEQLAGADNTSWNTGLRLTYPLGNDEAVHDHARTRVRVEQAKIRLMGLRETVTNEVRAALRELAASRKQQEVTARGRTYAEERFRAFQKKHEVGLATTRELLDVEQELAVARSSQITARTSLSVARQKLWRATGELLEMNGVDVAGDEGARQLDRLK